MSGYIGIHLTVVLIMHTGDGFAVQDGRIGIHTDRTKFPIMNKRIRENIQSEGCIRILLFQGRALVILLTKLAEP